MIGVDYSQRSIELANKFRSQYASHAATSDLQDIEFHVYDILNSTPHSQQWWPAREQGFDLVLDKGTFDAISLSSATIVDTESTSERRVCELYPLKALELVKLGGFLLVTSCNWTEAEVLTWFAGATSQTSDGAQQSRARFEVYDSIKYPVFEFGGQKGQGVASVCFKKVRGT
jgi:EEF1A lysine methyltransferase 2